MILNANEEFMLEQGDWSFHAGLNPEKQWYVSIWKGNLNQCFWFASSSKQRAEVFLDLMLMKLDSFK